MKILVVFNNLDSVIKENVEKVFCDFVDGLLYLSYGGPGMDKFVLSEIVLYTVLV